MIFFEDFKVDRNFTIGITGLLSNITTREGSHKGGWARLLRCQLINLGHTDVKILDNKDNLSDFDVVIFDMGAEYSGALNMFGGLDEKVLKRLNELKDFKGPIYSWCHQLPQLSVLEGRRNNASTCAAFKATEQSFLSQVQAVIDTCQVFDHVYKTDKLLIGDSHTPSVWTPEYMIERRDGRTLEGMVEHETVGRYIRTRPYLNEVHVHCSSIDVRHHVCRETKPEEYLLNLVVQLVDQLLKSGIQNVTLTHTMGIEDESRELPKTGYYRGTPFFGSWEQRNKVRQAFNEMIDGCTIAYNWNRIKFPEYFFDESGKLRFEVMEKPQSIHLSPEHYRWDLDNNRDRWIHEEGR